MLCIRFLLERAPEPAPTGDGSAVAPAAVTGQLDAVTDGRGPASDPEPVVGEDPGAVDGLEATSPVEADDPVASAAAAVPPPVPNTTTTTTAPALTSAPSTSTSTTVLPLAKAVVSGRGRVQTGQASWYHFLDASCAHRTLPFGTIVTVTQLDTGARARCRVADRGPADTSRVIDLSYDTLILLARPGTGLIDVRLQW